MSHILDTAIQETRGRIAAIDASVVASIQSIQADAATKIATAVKEAAANRAGLAVQLLHLEAAYGCTSTLPQATVVEAASAAPTPRPSARDVILSVLSADGPLPAAKLDAAVIAAGWTKAASTKTRSILKHRGLATSDRRIWMITEAGREKIKGR